MKIQQPLHVLMVHEDPCIRVLKEVQALLKKGVIVDVLCQSMNITPQLRSIVRNSYIVPNLNDMQIFLQAHYTEWDVIHCHNEPNTITAIALSTCTERPVIYDCHDMSSARSSLEGIEADIEKLCFTRSNGIIHVSEGIKKLAYAKYGPSLSIVLPSFPLAKENRIGAKPKLLGQHVVYQGTIVGFPAPTFSYRFYLPMFQRLVAAGIHVHVFPSKGATDHVLTGYRALAEKYRHFHLYKSLPYSELIATMSQFQWGFSGFNFDYLENQDTINFLNCALPNKFFDYLLAGVCPVVINNATTADFVKKLDVGYSAKSMDDFVDICTTRATLPPLSDLSYIDMETQIGRLLELYAATLSSR